MDLWTLTDLCTPWCLHVVVTLRIADHLAAGHSDVATLAKLAEADRDYLHRVLRHLVSKGVFEEPSPGDFALNDTSRGLLDDAFRIGLNLDGIGGRMAYAWGTLLSAVRKGRPAYDEQFGRPFWQDLDAHPDVAASFDALMGPGHGIPDPSILANPEDWSFIKTVADVGGGTGALLTEILRAHSNVHGILVDLPRTIEKARDAFAHSGLSDRVTFAAQSFFDPLPPGADLYVLKNVLGDWPDQEAAAILKRCAEAAHPSGRVCVFTSGGEEESPELLMLVLLGGKGRSLSQLKEMARAVGLEFSGITRQASGRSVAEFRPT